MDLHPLAAHNQLGSQRVPFLLVPARFTIAVLLDGIGSPDPLRPRGDPQLHKALVEIDLIKLEREDASVEGGVIRGRGFAWLAPLFARLLPARMGPSVGPGFADAVLDD